MRLAILSREARSYSSQRLKNAAVDAGHEVRILDTLRFAIDLSGDAPDLHYSGNQLSDYDSVIPRIGTSVTYFGTAVVRQLEQMGLYTPSSSAGIRLSRDKLHAHQILARHGIGMPATTFVRDRHDISEAIARIGGAPVVIKLLEGTQGVGVMLAPDETIAKAVIETLQSTKQLVLVQEYVEESSGSDVRAIVVGDRVVASMRRTSTNGDFRSNLHQQGQAEAVELAPEFAAAAVKAAQVMGLSVAGVDMLESARGPLVMEVNSSPGLQGIEKATGVDVARTIVDYVESQVAFPALDVRQRLTMKSGYGVAEILVQEGRFAGETIESTGLAGRDIVVLTVERGDDQVANPRPGFALEADDRLLCFGSLEEMRDLLPKFRSRRRPNKQLRPRL